LPEYLLADDFESSSDSVLFLNVVLEFFKTEAGDVLANQVGGLHDVFEPKTR
jgi:hypothetical protein